ncbi:coiled-coil domain-containing protein 28B isoform X3 [Rhagoletis pomonella]|uniref:coiled-coil domain-containing protein 28B isoform X3 n=1 Tax=Rhagoletis pomonella TaxID=28610 RepID=UPI00177D05EB|nr:coiled-coil domain-containing protein 28B isoform X3 [Rhagoletis pomonella]
METNDEVVERQKLVSNDIDGEEDHNNLSTIPQSDPISVASPPSPTVPKINIKTMSSGDTTRSRNSASCSIERTSEKGQLTSAKVTYVNERRPRPHLHGSASVGCCSNDERLDFKSRPRKLLKVPDVKHMERALLGLLDDFHSGKLKAFGSGCTMEQMTKIREQQESLAKLHFELAAAEEDSLENVNDLNSAKAQENMLQLVQRLEQLSVSIEQLQTSHTGL